MKKKKQKVVKKSVRFKKRHILLLILFCGMYFMGRYEMKKTEAEQQAYFKQFGIEPKFDWIETPTRKLHYTQTGLDTDSATTIIFLHGSPGSSSDFEAFLADSSLIQKTRLISVDRPGFGLSSKHGIGVASLEQQAEMLKPLVQKYQKSGLILVGHSWGGPVIAQIAMDYGYETDQLIFVAASLFGELEPYEWYRTIFKFPLVRWMIPRTLVASNTELYTSIQQLNDMLPKWKNIRQRTTILQGTKDRLVHPDNGTLAKKHLVNATADLVWIEDADHFLPWSHPQYINEAINKHLDILHLKN